MQYLSSYTIYNEVIEGMRANGAMLTPTQDYTISEIKGLLGAGEKPPLVAGNGPTSKLRHSESILGGGVFAPKSGKCENSAQKWPDYVKSAVCTREKAIVPLSVSS